jgi:hypothetical protein
MDVSALVISERGMIKKVVNVLFLGQIKTIHMPELITTIGLSLPVALDLVVI